MDALSWAEQFATWSPVRSAVSYGSGHINDTFQVMDAGGRRYLLQRVGPPTFARPDQVMANIVLVTQAMMRCNPDRRRRLSLIPTTAGEWWLPDGGFCWRMYDFIDACELASPLTTVEFALVGQAFGEFLGQMADIAPGSLHVTIEDYHNEPRYIARLKSFVAADPCGRADSVRADIERVLAYEAISHDFDDTDMPLRVTHNDAKVSNVLFDTETRQPLCVVDLDTVQPGYAALDFGDMIRSGASSAPENEPDVSLVGFVPELFEACLSGYLKACGGVLTPSEVTRLPEGARLMTLETSLRFLTDHIAGDVFYHVDYAGQNLERARNQATLLADIDAHMGWMRRAVAAV